MINRAHTLSTGLYEAISSYEQILYIYIHVGSSKFHALVAIRDSQAVSALSLRCGPASTSPLRYGLRRTALQPLCRSSEGGDASLRRCGCDVTQVDYEANTMVANCCGTCR